MQVGLVQPVVQPKVSVKSDDKMLQIFYNPNNGIIIDLSCNGNTLISFNHRQLTKLTLYITHHISIIILAL